MHTLQEELRILPDAETSLNNLGTSLLCNCGVLHSRHRRRCHRCQSVQGEQRQTASGGRARQRGRQGEHFSGIPSSVRPPSGRMPSPASPPLLLSPKAPKTRCTENARAKTGSGGDRGRRTPKVAKGHIANTIFALWALNRVTFAMRFRTMVCGSAHG